MLREYCGNFCDAWALTEADLFSWVLDKNFCIVWISNCFFYGTGYLLEDAKVLRSTIPVARIEFETIEPRVPSCGVLRFMTCFSLWLALL